MTARDIGAVLRGYDRAIVSGIYSDYEVHTIYQVKMDAEAELRKLYEQSIMRCQREEPGTRTDTFEQWMEDYYGDGHRIEEFDWVPGDATPLSLEVSGRTDG